MKIIQCRGRCDLIVLTFLALSAFSFMLGHAHPDLVDHSMVPSCLDSSIHGSEIPPSIWPLPNPKNDTKNNDFCTLGAKTM